MTVMLIRKLAKDMAAAFYEENRSERFRKMWKSRREFVGRSWVGFVDQAEKTLISMLADKNTPEYTKNEIYEAILEQRERDTGPGVRGVKPGIGRLNLNPLHPGTMERKVFHDG